MSFQQFIIIWQSFERVTRISSQGVT